MPRKARITAINAEASLGLSREVACGWQLRQYIRMSGIDNVLPISEILQAYRPHSDPKACVERSRRNMPL